MPHGNQTLLAQSVGSFYERVSDNGTIPGIIALEMDHRASWGFAVLSELFYMGCLNNLYRGILTESSVNIPKRLRGKDDRVNFGARICRNCGVCPPLAPRRRSAAR
jgi:hypothetical protein